MAKKQTKQSAPTPKGRSSWTLLSWVGRSLLGVAGLVLAVFVILAFLSLQYPKNIFPGVRIGAMDFSGLSTAQARERLNERIVQLEEQGIAATSPSKNETIDSTVTSTSTIDSAVPLFTYDVDGTVSALFAYGRTTNGLTNSWQRIRSLLFHVRLDAGIDLDKDALIKELQTSFSAEEKPPVDSHISFSGSTASATAAASGMIFPYSAYTDQIFASLKRLERPVVSLTLIQANPSITQEAATPFLSQAQNVVARAPFSIVWQDKTWTVSGAEIAASLDVGLVNGKPRLIIAEKGFAGVLDRIKKDVEIEAKDSKFSIENGKVVAFQESQKGRVVDVSALLLSMQDVLTNTSPKPIQLVVREISPQITNSSAGDLGITELVATATTNFKGSPPNRRHNIANGVRLLNGSLIKPGETFSVITALKPIEKTNGYLPELVIKGDRTIPEVGGGLCQIGTTMFRVVMNAGLPVVERRNHSYRVSYYEPPVGMDATVYDPKPDFRFTNDYENNLLLMGRVEGDNVTFELWGTKDGRKINISTPRLFNVTSPGPTKYIESDDVKPGEQKCIEKAHKGGSTEFTYSVTYPNGENKSQVFSSKYRAWQAVCLVGKAKEKKTDTTPKKTTNTNASTNTNTATNTNTPAPTNTNTTTNTNS